MGGKNMSESIPKIIPKKCCFNCANGVKYSIPKKESNEYAWAIEFNNTKRICVANYRMPSYPMYERRHCRYFEEKPEFI